MSAVDDAPPLFVVSADAQLADQIMQWLAVARWDVRWAVSLDRALADPDHLRCSILLVCVDTAKPERSKLLRRALARFPESVIVTVSEDGDDDFVAAEAIEAGVQECLAVGGLTQSALSRALSLAEARGRGHRRLAATSAELYEANQELSDFAHVVAHDLRAPVRLTALLADRLVAAEPGTARAFELADRLQLQLSYQERMLASLLEYVSLKTELPLPVDFDLIPVIEDGVGEMVHYFGLHPSAVRLVAPGSCNVQASELHVGRVIRHLITNAIVHHPNRLDLRLEIVVDDVGSTCRVTVADNGRGIPAHCRDQVFRPLERLATDAEGVGLGLSICRRIVEAYGGTIKVVPPGHYGAVLAMELPAVDSPVAV
jgi:signal transduction histidine kinase